MVIPNRYSGVFLTAGQRSLQVDRLRGVTVVALLSLFLWGCSSAPSPSMPIVDEAIILEDYRIGAGDALQINVWRNPELSLSVPVRPDGRISMPLVGDVQAAERTATALAKDIENLLTDFVRSPQVTVIVANPDSADFQRRVRITGAVTSPQSLPYRNGMTVLDLVLMAGGTTDFASLNKAKLYRKAGDEVRVYPIRLNDLIHKGRLETNYPLQPSDIITVPERSF